jgi:iron-sulfur cluster repair protein YtfE (RIC family)
MELSAGQIRSLILDEHAMLRDLLEDIQESFADAEARTPGSVDRLTGRMRRFYEALLKHITHEETVLRPVVAEADAWGAARVEKMDEEHRVQRAAVRALSALTFTSDLDAELRRVRDFTQAIGRDMDAEERECLSEEVLRDDVIVIDTFTG